MGNASKALVLVVLLAAIGSEAQVAMAPEPVLSLGSAAFNPAGPNTLVLGSGTSVTYDSNALNSRPPTPNVQYTVFPQIGLNLARPRWDALVSFVPSFSYSSANLPQYQAVSLTSSITVQYRPTQRLLLNFMNSLVSSTNPFDSLTAGYQLGQSGTVISTGASLNYLPKTNEAAAADLAYSLGARTALTALGTYNYLSYQHDPNIPSAAQPFQQSTSGQFSIGLRRSSSPRYQSKVLYVAQFFDAGQGLIKTIGQSVQYALQYSPTPTLRISAMIGPEYSRNTYANPLASGVGASVVNQRAAGWSWTGNAALTWTRGKHQLAVSASKQLSLGTQYQGNVDETLFQANVRRQLTRGTELTFFGGYNMNRPVFLAQSLPRFSNNYLSTGASLNKIIAKKWVLGVAYWYLLQDSPQNASYFYSGDHNRFSLSLSYSITKPLRK